MPPPPLPAFLLPKHPLIPFAQNDSKLCYTTYMCETLPGSRLHTGIEFIELPGQSLNDAWLFVVIASIVGVILLITVVTFTFIKCREYVLFPLFCQIDLMIKQKLVRKSREKKTDEAQMRSEENAIEKVRKSAAYGCSFNVV